MKIAEVSEKYGLSIDTLRYYERIGLISTVTRNKGGMREYGERDLKRVEFVKCMRGAGLSIEVLIEYIELVGQGDATIPARKEILIEQQDLLKGKIHEFQKTLDLLNHKIEVYESALLKREKEIGSLED